jgi:4-diphosphocytidyl-2-C-methyl-D-erythritol kinase
LNAAYSAGRLTVFLVGELDHHEARSAIRSIEELLDEYMPRDCVLVVCKPDFGVSTPELYQKIDTVAIAHRPDHKAMERALQEGDLEQVCANIYNVFDPLVTADHLEMNYIKSVMNSYGAMAFQMTGSGSAIFCVLPSFEHAAVVCNMLKDNYPDVFICMPV